MNFTRTFFSYSPLNGAGSGNAPALVTTRRTPSQRVFYLLLKFVTLWIILNLPLSVQRKRI